MALADTLLAVQPQQQRNKKQESDCGVKSNDGQCGKSVESKVTETTKSKTKCTRQTVTRARLQPDRRMRSGCSSENYDVNREDAGRRKKERDDERREKIMTHSVIRFCR